MNKWFEVSGSQGVAVFRLFRGAVCVRVPSKWVADPEKIKYFYGSKSQIIDLRDNGGPVLSIWQQDIMKSLKLMPYLFEGIDHSSNYEVYNTFVFRVAKVFKQANATEGSPYLDHPDSFRYFPIDPYSIQTFQHGLCEADTWPQQSQHDCQNNFDIDVLTPIHWLDIPVKLHNVGIIKVARAKNGNAVWFYKNWQVTDINFEDFVEKTGASEFVPLHYLREVKSLRDQIRVLQRLRVKPFEYTQLDLLQRELFGPQIDIISAIWMEDKMKVCIRSAAELTMLRRMQACAQEYTACHSQSSAGGSISEKVRLEDRPVLKGDSCDVVWVTFDGEGIVKETNRHHLGLDVSYQTE
jgi:hypothetical protein